MKNMNDRNWLDEIRAEVEEERRNYKGPHCCLTMDAELMREDAVLQYDPRFREYGIEVARSSGCMPMDYCMFCGTKLPLSLRHHWFDILEKEYGLERPVTGDKKKVPQQFWTDEWWKVRGL
jgi:hypothetical protein